MNLLLICQIAQIILALSLVFFTLIQSKGQGLSSSFVGNIGFYRSRRGLEKGVFVLTILSAVLLVANSLLIVILK